LEDIENSRAQGTWISLNKKDLGDSRVNKSTFKHREQAVTKTILNGFDFVKGS